MKKESRLVLSHNQYAVALSGMAVKDQARCDGTFFFYMHFPAVWFRRQKGVLRACGGYLWDYQDEKTTDAATALARHTDGRYGGTCEARWDGRNLWCLEDEQLREHYKNLLVPLLADYPAIPAGYDGWWRF